MFMIPPRKFTGITPPRICIRVSFYREMTSCIAVAGLLACKKLALPAAELFDNGGEMAVPIARATQIPFLLDYLRRSPDGGASLGSSVLV
jgi:hypothetical protein